MSGTVRVKQTGRTEMMAIPATGLEKGLYIVHVRNGSTKYTQKIQVQ